MRHSRIQWLEWLAFVGTDGSRGCSHYCRLWVNPCRLTEHRILFVPTDWQKDSIASIQSCWAAYVSQTVRPRGWLETSLPSNICASQLGTSISWIIESIKTIPLKEMGWTTGTGRLERFRTWLHQQLPGWDGHSAVPAESEFLLNGDSCSSR